MHVSICKTVLRTCLLKSHTYLHRHARCHCAIVSMFKCCGGAVV